ncbi:hypothetical protein HK104_003713 [Borealophlyctis nickersoniae]|nr:hypothetical protein HK104_003713 [Borealophlyctis nickersoniae]
MEQYLAELEDLLKQVLGGHTAQAASATLEQRYYQQPQCIPALAQIALAHPDGPVRNLAAVELRKQVKEGIAVDADKWEKVDEVTRNQIKQRLLEHIVVEPENGVRHALARVISEVAKKELDKERWADLITFIYTCCQSSTAAHREIGVYVLFALFEVMPDQLGDHISQLLLLFRHTLADPESPEVRVITLRALGRLVDFLDPDNTEDIKVFRSLLPGMLTVIQQCLDNGDEDKAAKGFEVFNNLLVLELPIITTSLTPLVEFFTRVGSNREYGANVRSMALSFLMWATVCHKTRIQKLKLISPIVASMFPIAAEDEPEDDEEDSPVKVALQVLSSMSTTFAPTEVFGTAMKNVVEYLNAQDPRARKAAVLALAVLVDGCADYMRPKIAEILELVSRSLQDPEAIVRRAGCMAVGSLAEELQEEIGAHHATILPLIFNLMSDPHPAMQKSSINALDAILEGLGDAETTHYLPGLMTKLVAMLDNSPPKVKGSVIACIGSAANAAGDHLMALTASMDDLDLRGITIDAIGSVAEAVGKDAFRPHLNDIMRLTLDGIESENHRLRECCYVFFGVIARVFEEEFAPYLTVIVPQLIKSCQLPEASFETDLVEDELDSKDDKAFMSLHNAVAAEKESAVDALGQIFAATRAVFLPYVEQTVNILYGFLDHNHEDVRKSTVGSLFMYVDTFYKMSNPPPEWVPGLPLRMPLHDNVKSMAKLVMDGIKKLLEDETDRLVVAQTFNELKDALQDMGPAIFPDDNPAGPGNFRSIAEIIHQVLQQEHACQCDEVEDFEDDDESEGGGSRFISPRNPHAPPPEANEDEVAELDAMLIEAAVELVAAMAKALGPDFAPYFQQYYPLIAKYYKKNKSVSDRNMVVGAFSEIALALGSAVTPFTGDLIGLFVKALSDEEEEVKGNAAFAVGVLIQNSETDLTSYYEQILVLLRPMIDTPTLLNTIDNGCGAIARMISRSPDAIPLDGVLPVLLQQLPLKKDYAENEPVYTCIFGLLNANNPYLVEHMPQLLNVFAQVLAPPEEQLKPATREQMLKFLNMLQVQHSDSFRNMLGGLQADYANTILSNLR